MTPARLARMPEALGDDAAFTVLYTARCARAWLSSSAFEVDAPAAVLPALWRARMWSPKDRDAYDKTR
jgi:hypothetical protein